MRIAIHIIFIAVVSLAACAVGWHRETRYPNSNESSPELWSSEGEEAVSDEGSSTWLNAREYQKLLKKAKGYPVDCCPTKMEMSEPRGGKNKDGIYVELYMDGINKQRFFEPTCRDGVEGRPCQFIERKLYNQSRCIQRYSYTYAIVKSPEEPIRHHHHLDVHTVPIPSNSNWTLDYIKVRDGCSCQVFPKIKKKRKRGGKERRESEEPH